MEAQNPKRGHHVFNNIPKLVCSTIDDVCRRLWKENFNDLYKSNAPSFPETAKDFKYWDKNSVVNAQRNKLVVDIPGRTEDPNVQDYSEAAESFREKAMLYLSCCADGSDHSDEYSDFKIEEAVTQLKANCVDEEAETRYLQENGRGVYDEVKYTLFPDIDLLPSRVMEWGKEIAAYSRFKYNLK